MSTFLGPFKGVQEVHGAAAIDQSFLQIFMTDARHFE